MKYFKFLLLVLIFSAGEAMKRPCPVDACQVRVVAQQIAKRKIEKHEELIRMFHVQEPISREIELIEEFLLLRKLATTYHYVPLLKNLLDKKLLDPNSKFLEKSTGRVYRLINEAVYHQAYENAQLLLQGGADPNRPAHNYARQDYAQELPLLSAVDNLDNEMLQVLLKDNKATPNKHSSDFLPLTRAIHIYMGTLFSKVKEDALQSIKILLQHGANPDEVEKILDGSEILIKNTCIPLTPRSLATHRELADVLALLPAPDTDEQELRLLSPLAVSVDVLESAAPKALPHRISYHCKNAGCKWKTVYKGCLRSHTSKCKFE